MCLLKIVYFNFKKFYFFSFLFSKAVALDRPCQFTEQCSFSPHTLCVQGKCSCADGYSSYATSGCLQGLSINKYHNLSTEKFYNEVITQRN